jgi:hypothetical protein
VKLSALALVLTTTTALLAGCGGGKASTDSGKPPDQSGAAAGASSTLSPEAAEAEAMGDVNQVAPRLQAYFAAHGYPTDLAGLARSMTQAGLFMDPSDALASYQFNPKNKQWSMCVQNDTGAWASFDTGSIGGHGKTGGCPKS